MAKQNRFMYAPIAALTLRNGSVNVPSAENGTAMLKKLSVQNRFRQKGHTIQPENLNQNLLN